MVWPELLMALVVLLLAMGWYPCCCEEQCQFCSGSSHQQYYSVDIPAPGNGTCSDCADYLGTYILEYYDTAFGPGSPTCRWRNVSTDPAGCCSGDIYTWMYIRTGIGGGTEVRVYQTCDNTFTWFWNDEPGTGALDCDFTDLELTGNAASYECTASGTTAEVSSYP